MTSDNWNGEKYRDNSDPQERFALAMLERLTLKGKERVLDVGCGDGRVTAQIALRVPNGRVVGIDASQSMITACIEAHGSRSNLSFEVADAATFSSDEQFDAAVSFSALHWVSDLSSAMANIRNALKAGGTVLVGMGGSHQKEIAEVFSKERWRNLMAGKPRAFHGRTREELSGILTECGFTEIGVETIENARPYENEKALLDWIMAWLPHATGLKDRDAVEFGREIVDNVRASQSSSQQGLVLRSTMLAAIAKRP